MKPIDQITKQILEVGQKSFQTNLTKSQESQSKKTGLPNEWVSALFKRFQARYGHKFQSAMEGIEEMAVKEWSIGLSGLTGAQIKKGLDAWKEPWPPSLPEFIEACLDEQSKHPMYIESRKALPPPLCKKEIADAQREKLRKLGIKV